MAENKTQPTQQNVADFLNGIPGTQKRQDSFAIMRLMRELTGTDPRMWGSSIVGFGDHHYRYASGRGGDWFLVGFSPRKQSLTLYINGRLDQYDELLAALGKHSTGKACLYIKRLADIDLAVLSELIQRSVEHANASPQED